jgi:hypothetical protein
MGGVAWHCKAFVYFKLVLDTFSTHTIFELLTLDPCYVC